MAATLVVRYVIPSDGDDFEHPNVFTLSHAGGEGAAPLRLQDIRAAFPLPGAFHFRFMKSFGSGPGGYVWLDVLQDDDEVPMFNGQVFAKVARVVTPPVVRTGAAAGAGAGTVAASTTAARRGEVAPAATGARGSPQAQQSQQQAQKQRPPRQPGQPGQPAQQAQQQRGATPPAAPVAQAAASAPAAAAGDTRAPLHKQASYGEDLLNLDGESDHSAEPVQQQDPLAFLGSSSQPVLQAQPQQQQQQQQQPQPHQQPMQPGMAGRAMHPQQPMAQPMGAMGMAAMPGPMGSPAQPHHHRSSSATQNANAFMGLNPLQQQQQQQQPR